MVKNKMSKYLLWFAHEHVDFRYAEVQAILSMFKIKMNFTEEHNPDNPYWIVELPNEESARKLASRSISIKSCIELWSRAKTENELHKNLKHSLKNNTEQWSGLENGTEIINTSVCPSYLIDRCCGAEKSFKIEVETFCKHFSLKNKVEKIEHFSYLPMEGPVKLKNPDVTLMYMEFYGVDCNNVPDEPYDLFFGRWVVDGQRDVIQLHSLKKRTFIGNTSMDAQLSLLMANQAQVQCADIVLDPFVGSGSILVAAAHFGGHVWGTDIDYMMLHGRTRPTRDGQKSRSKEDSVSSNMRQYGTQSKYLDVIVSDFSLPLWREGLQFDAIITDPPYGVREPAEKIGIEKENYALSEEYLSTHIPSKVEYGLPHIYKDLLHFAALHLKLGRRLVCWYPLVREEYTEDRLPTHPSLKLIANSEQLLTKLTSRRLLTYEKVHEPEASVTTDTIEMYNFRESFFAAGEVSRRERKARVAEELAANADYIRESKINSGKIEK